MQLKELRLRVGLRDLAKVIWLSWDWDTAHSPMVTSQTHVYRG